MYVKYAMEIIQLNSQDGNNYLELLAEEFRGDENQLVDHMSNFPINFRQLFQFAQCTSYKQFLV